MIFPRLAGSALNRASWWSPIASKASPTAQSTAPAQAHHTIGPVR